MFRIGEFSHVARVSPRLLRHYEEVGLLFPAFVDPENGYRYYVAEQLSDLNRILALRDLGLSLEEIRPLVDGEVGPDTLRTMLISQQAVARRRVVEEQTRAALIESRIAEIEHGYEPVDLIVKEERDRILVGFREICAGVDHGRELLAELLAGLQIEEDPPQVAALTFSDFEAENLDIHIGFLGRGDLEGASLPSGRRLEPAPFSGGTMLTAIRTLDPVLGHGLYASLGRWMDAHDYRLAGPTRELFHTLPSDTEPAVVEVQFPVAQRIQSDGQQGSRDMNERKTRK